MNPTTIPQIKPHYRVEIIEPKQVYLLGEQASHGLTGQLYCQILPLLDGKNTLDDIVKILDGDVPPDYIDFVLNRLSEKGYLTEAAPELSPEIAAFWTELGVPPTDAAHALQEQQVTLTVVGNSIDAQTLANLTAALGTIGVQVQDPEASSAAPALNLPALNIVITDDYLQPELAEINQQALETQQPWLLMKPMGSVVWLGPIFVPGETGCWQCLSQRLRGNREVETSVLRQKLRQQRAQENGTNGNTPVPSRLDLVGCLPTARATLPSTLQTGLQLAATEIAKWLVKHYAIALTGNSDENTPLRLPLVRGETGTPSPELSRSVPEGRRDGWGGVMSTIQGKLLTFNQTTLDLQTHALPHRPQCSACGDTNLLQERGFQPLTLESRQKHFTRDGGHRAVAPSQTVETYKHLISPISGIVTNLVRVSDPANPLVHTYSAGHSFGSATSLRGLRSNLKHKSSGKGKTDQQSQASGFCEAVERYSGIYQGDEPKKRATLAELGDRAINPEICLCFSDDQYANRETFNQNRQAAHDWISQRFDPSQAIDWTPVWSLTEQHHKYLPTAFCYYDYPLPKGQNFCKADSNGNAAGNTLEEAILQGFMELVERDSVALWWYNRLRRPAVDLTSFDEPYFLELQQFYADNDRKLWVLDLTADLGIPAFAGVSQRLVGESERLILGFGAHLDPTIAVLRALTEVNQLGLELDKVPDDQLDGDAKTWLLDATLENQSYLAPNPDQPLKTVEDYPKRWGNDIRDDVITCVDILREAGLETLVLDQTRPDIGLNVVKVIVPGMRHFWSRFGSGRLYDVPVKMGWREEPLAEGEMNSMAMPF